MEYFHAIITSHNTFCRRILQVSRLQHPLPVSPSLGVRDPDRLLRVVGLLLVRSLHLDGGEQELRGVGVHGALHQLDVARHLVRRELNTGLKNIVNFTFSVFWS